MTKEFSVLNDTQYEPLPPDLEKPLRVVLDHVHSGSNVSLEGTPLYLGNQWDDSCDFGYNKILSSMNELLGRQWCLTKHIALIDDFTTNGQFGDLSFIDYMLTKPNQVYFESEFSLLGEEVINSLSRENQTLTQQKKLFLSLNGRSPCIQTTLEKPSCELLDALFQAKKPGEVAVIIHPSSFRKQQEDMRQILMCINGGILPFEIINLFYKNHTISKIFSTDRNGSTKQIY